MQTLTHNNQSILDQPPFWTEEWLESALNELNSRNLTPEERLQYSFSLAKDTDIFRQLSEGKALCEFLAKKEMVLKLIQIGWPDDAIARIVIWPVETVTEIRKEIA